MKRVMAVILSATTIFATFPVGVNASHGEEAEGNLATFFNQYSQYSGYVYAFCKDIDNDDINEVIISEGNDNYSFYKKIDDSYKKIGSIYAQYGIYNADNGIIICFGGSGMSYYKNYYIMNNNLMEGNLIASYEGDGYSYNSYIVDGKNVSENEYTNKENEILSNRLYFREYWISNNSSIKVILNGEEITFEQPPYIENGTTMVPMRAIFEALGASVDYDTETKTITATKGNTVIKLFANSDTATVNGKEVTLTSPVANKNGTTMVPLRLVSEALGAEVSWDEETKVVTINLDEEVTDKMVFSSNDTSLSFKVGEDIIIGVGLDKDNVTDEELNNIKISMDDRYSVVPYDSKIVDNKKYFYFKANTEGNYSIYAENSKTGESVEIPLSINKNKTYNIGSVPTQKVDGEDVIVNNFSGMTIDNYKEEKLKNGSCNVSFDVYNTKSVYGEVEVYDSNGKIISAKSIEKNSDNATSMKGALLDNIKDLYGDIVEGTVFTYKQKSGYSKKTSVSVNIPKDGYIKITNDVKESYMVGVLNITDLCLQTKQILSVTGKTDSNTENKVAEKITSKEFLNKISAKLFENQGEFSEKVAEKLTNKIVFSADGIGNFLNSLSDIMNEADIDDIVESALIESGASVGQDVFTNVAGPAGTGLKAVFKVAEIENVILSIRHFETSLDKGAIVIQNK